VTGPTDEFVDLVSGPEDSVALDRGCLLIAAHAHTLAVADGMRALDDLAERCPASTVAGLRRYLFDTLGFAGNRDHYDDPQNSYLDTVLASRTGIPITLSVVTIEVGRRLGLTLTPVGMPGHFLVGVGDQQWLDAFDGGHMLDVDACRARFTAAAGPEMAWRDEMLDPVGPRVVLARVLNNLRHLFTTTGALVDLVWVLKLRKAIPGAPVAERAELASVLTTLGRYADAGAELEDLADVFDMAGNQPAADELRARAVQTRARLN
jgi:regulator of sirC expression with transglutaminase-like and TPR domain